MEKEKRMEMISLETIQKNLRNAIKYSGIRQKDIAKAIGVSPQTVSKYMKEDIFPALDTFGKLCCYLDISSDEIFRTRE